MHAGAEKRLLKRQRLKLLSSASASFDELVKRSLEVYAYRKS